MTNPVDEMTLDQLRPLASLVASELKETRAERDRLRTALTAITSDSLCGTFGEAFEIAFRALHGDSNAVEPDEIRDLACCDTFVRESASEFCATCGYTNLDHLRRGAERTNEHL